MLIRMNVRDLQASVDVGQVHEGISSTGGISGIYGALEDVDGPGVEIGGSTAVGHCGQLQVVFTLLDSATVGAGIAAGIDSDCADLCPAVASVLALPDSAIHFAGGRP